MKFTYPSGSRPLDGYTIKRGIGQGGFGEVYYATSDAGKEVALKLIRRNLDVELRGVTQCLNLKHANLVALYDIKVDERGDNWVVMEYVSGESLEDTLVRYPTGMPIDEALLWFCGIAAGVAYLHDRGIVHRDLKPGNIFNDEGQVKIGDYGLSKFISASRRSGQTESVGTVHYMAPEIANGRYGKEIDLYALGVILYELLSGQVPFEGESVGEVLMKHLTAEPDVTRVPEPFRELVARALAKDPARRPHSVAEFLAALPAGMAPTKASPSLPPPQRTEPPAEDVVPFPPARGQAAPAGFGPAPAPAPPAPAPAALAEPKIITWWRSLHLPAKVALAFVGGLIAVRFVPVFIETVVGVGESRIAGRPSTLLMLVGAIVVASIVLRRSKRKDPPGGPRHREHNPPFARAAQVRHADPVAPVAPQPAPLRPAQPAPAVTRQQGVSRKQRAQQILASKTSRDKLTELLGSLLLSACVAGAAALLMLVVQRDHFQAEYAWLALSGALGAWCVIIPSKLWEGREGDQVLRRFAFLAIGLAFGLLAYQSARFLHIMLPNEIDLPHTKLRAAAAYDPHGQPALMSYLAYFGFLFLLVRWWRNTDPLRPTRLSLVSVAVPVMWAAVLNAFWQFPQPWGMMLAGTISLAVQLASPWFDPVRLTNTGATRTPAAEA